MKISAWGHLIGREMRAQRGRVILLIGCVALSCAICGLALNVLIYLRADVRPYIRTLFPEQRLIARPANLDLAFLRFDVGKITEDKIAAVKALPEVEAVYPQMPITFPAMADIRIDSLGVAFETEIVVLGVPGELIAGELGEGVVFDYAPESKQPLPVVASAYFLDMYNMGLAESAGLPKLSKSAAIGQEFDLVLGQSTIAMTDDLPMKRVRARVAGLVGNPDLMGIAVPIDAVRAWNREYRPSEAPKYSLLHIDAKPDADDVEVRRKLGQLGLQVKESSESLRRVRRAIGGLEWALIASAGIVLLLASVGIVSTVAMAARERRAAWGLHRATGLRPIELVSLVKAEAALIGLIAGAIAIVADGALMILLKKFFADNIQHIASLPGDPLALHAEAMIAVMLIAVMLVIVPAVLFAFNAARVEPVELLQEKSL